MLDPMHDEDLQTESMWEQYNIDESDVDLEFDKHGRKQFRKGIVTGVICSMLIVAAAGIGLGLFSRGSALTVTDGISDEAVYQKAKLLRSLIKRDYLNDFSDETLADGIYSGMLNSLGDPYSCYYNEADYKSIIDSTSGAYAGIGAYISQYAEDGRVVITKPFEDSPAAKAGLLPGDEIVAVDGNKIDPEEDLTTIVSRIKGEAGTQVVLTILRKEEEMDVAVTRDKIVVKTVEGRMMNDGIGVISILEFDDVTAKQFHEQLTGLQEQGMTKLIVDLRDNPGGSYQTVCEILDEILPEGLIVYTEDKNGNRDEMKSDAAHSLNIPMAVLVNGYSASASEIFAGAIRDYEWGTLIGTKTYGKGIVQRLIDLKDGTGMKITVSKYYTPLGENIHEVGIEPDITVEIPEDAYEDGILSEEEDTQLQKALEVLKEL